MADIQRLRLIKRLTLDGHAIGTVAGLAHDDLVLLSAGGLASAASDQRVVVVGRALAQKLQSRLRPAVALVLDDLDQAETGIATVGAADVLVVHVASLHPTVTERVLALRTHLPASSVMVIYSFGAEAVADALRVAGVTVRREPIAGQELARLIAGIMPRQAIAAGRPGDGVAPRRYSDAELAALTEMPSRVACECPRHLAEIVSMLVDFERYSAECVSQNETDARLHRHLHGVTGVARTMFEQALAAVVIDEGLVV